MNWAGLFVLIGLLGLAWATWPAGIVILIGLVWVFSRG